MEFVVYLCSRWNQAVGLGFPRKINIVHTVWRRHEWHWWISFHWNRKNNTAKEKHRSGIAERALATRVLIHRNDYQSAGCSDQTRSNRVSSTNVDRSTIPSSRMIRRETTNDDDACQSQVRDSLRRRVKTSEDRCHSRDRGIWSIFWMKTHVDASTLTSNWQCLKREISCWEATFHSLPHT